MAGDERPCICDCDCGCNDVFGDKGDTTVRILGSVDSSIDLYVSTPPRTKWVFVDNVEREVTKFPTGWSYVGQDTDEQC